MKLNCLLEKNNNNLGLFRVLIAWLVIYGHAYALTPHINSADFTSKLMQIEVLASLAVKLFFFISGLVVTNSLLNKKSIKHFLISRFFRIYPAYFAVLFFSAFCIAPLISELSFYAYFKNTENTNYYHYFFNNLFLNTQFNIIGVFEHNYFPSTFNGSLWTIPYEIYAYVVLLVLYVLGIFRQKIWPIIVLLSLLVDIFTGANIFFFGNVAIGQIAFCFASGAFMAFFQTKIAITFFHVFGAVALAIVFSASSFFSFFLYYAIFISLLYLSSLKWFLKLRMQVDISYGIYLWAFPIQQILVAYFPCQGMWGNLFMTIVVVTPIACLSWIFIEKPSMKLGNFILFSL